ncbi:MAG: ABC transporter ATP-binding protein [Deltaproteobacteria bacterium]|nr:ABC transporter ATP-binding protein [Deltaproteobacteria bacterium]
MLQVENVTKSFDGFLAVDGASLRVQQGEIVAVIGPNGAGKTTLFNLITGQFFQIANIFPRLSVFRNVQVSVLSQQGKSGTLFRSAQKMAVEEANRILKYVGLNDKAQRLAGSLSHGDQRILEIAIALGNEPQLLILDEPTAGMSPDETKRTMDLIKELAETRGLTILFCEHDMDIVFNVAKSIMVMHHGRTLIQGSPEEVRENKEVQEAYLGGEDA